MLGLGDTRAQSAQRNMGITTSATASDTVFPTSTVARASDQERSIRGPAAATEIPHVPSMVTKSITATQDRFSTLPPREASSNISLSPTTQSHLPHRQESEDHHSPGLPMEPPNKRPRIDGPTTTHKAYRSGTQPPNQSSITSVETCQASTLYDNEDEPLQFSHPNRFLSIFDENAIDWLTRELGTTDFIFGARKLAAEVGRREKLSHIVQSQRKSDPDYSTALTWTQAYFKQDSHIVFGIIVESLFYEHLRLHYESGAKDDPAWYAIRNTIFATGCRFTLSEDDSPASYAEACRQAWGFFENALSVHTELIYYQTSFTAIQALLIMAFYSEALGSPALEYMLVSNATRIAQAKGMHLRHRGDPTRVSVNTLRMRAWLWWCVYAYEKHLAYRSGRPSTIDDDYISCPDPTTPPTGVYVNLEFFRLNLQHAKLNARIAKLLTTEKAQQESLEALIPTVHQLCEEVEEWRKSMPAYYTSKPPFTKDKAPPDVATSAAPFLHSGYWSLLLSIHKVFCYPWTRGTQEAVSSSSVAIQRQKSTEIVAEASRQIIKGTQSVRATASSSEM